MKFAIRDDDINYFTRPADLEKIYSTIWDKCPVCLATIPFVSSEADVPIPPEYRNTNQVFPLGDNERLVQFLKNKIKEKKISIMLHGYHHEKYAGGYEFIAGKDLCAKIARGKSHLEELFDIKINTFVAPHTSLSKEGLDAVIGNGLSLLGPGSLLRPSRRSFHIQNITPFVKCKWYKLRYKMNYPYVIDISGHLELYCHGLVPHVSIDSLKKEFDFCYKKKGIFCLNTHYWEFFKDNNMRKVFNELWQYIDGFDSLKFTSVDNIFLSFNK